MRKFWKKSEAGSKTEVAEENQVKPEHGAEQSESEPEVVGLEEFAEGLETDVSKRIAQIQAETAQKEAGIEQQAEKGGLTQEDIEEIRASGFGGRIQTIRKKIDGLAESLKERAVGRKFNKFLKQSHALGLFENGSFDHIVYSESGKQLGTLVEGFHNFPESQISEHPELIDAAMRGWIKNFENAAQNNYGDYYRELPQKVEQFKKIFPAEIADEILNSTEIAGLKKEYFLNLLNGVHYQHKAKEAAKALGFSPEVTRDLVVDSIKKTIDRTYSDQNGDRGRRGVYSIDNAIKDFELPQDITFSLASEYIFEELANSKYFPEPKHVARIFGTNQDDQKKFFEYLRQQPGLKDGIKARLVKDFSKADFGAEIQVRVFCDQINLPDIHPSEISKDPEVKKAIEAGLIIAMKQGRVSTVFENHSAILHIRKEDVLSIPEAQTYLTEGYFEEISKGSSEYARKQLEFGNLDPEVLRKDFRSVKAMRTYVREHFVSRRWYGSEYAVNAGLEELPKLMELSGVTFLEIKDILGEHVADLLFSRDNASEGMRIIAEMPFNNSDFQDILKNIARNKKDVDPVFLNRIINVIRRVKAVGQFPAEVLATFIKEKERFGAKTESELQGYLDVVQKIKNSPSQEIAKIQKQLIDQVISTENPAEAYEKIEQIFIKNNLPFVAKVFKIFQVMHSEQILRDNLRAKENTSPVLRKSSTRLRYTAIYNDLLKVHIKTGNNSLREYLSLFVELEDVLESGNLESLDERQRRKAVAGSAKLKALYENSQLGTDEIPLDTEAPEQTLLKLKASLGVKEGQKTSERIAEMFASPLGYENLESILDDMHRSKQVADSRGRAYARSGVSIQPGDLIKGVEDSYLADIFQNGSVSKEYLGQSADSDSTPYDTDVTRVPEEQRGEPVKEIYQSSYAPGYGSVAFVVKDRGQFQVTSEGNPPKYDRSKYELFQTLGEKHWGVRTGFPVTEVDFIMVKDEFKAQPLALERLFFTIAENGYYVPVADLEGKIIFTPETFDRYRKIFAGIEHFDGGNLDVISSEDENYYPQIEAIIAEKNVSKEKFGEQSERARNLVRETLEEFGVRLKDDFDSSLLGAELIDTGSTGRGTNDTGNADFDFMLRLDDIDFNKAQNIASSIIQKVGTGGREPSMINTFGNTVQVRMFGVKLGDSEPMDVDVGFAPKSQLVVYSSNEAVRDKLENIRDVYGERVREEVVANIILAKRLLKEGKAYKKGNHGDGGLGGIGVENLILANGGNLRKAFESFYNASKGPAGEILSFDEFKKNYQIRDPAINLRYGRNDNFVLNMNEQGYEKMLQVIEQQFPELKK